MVFSVPSWHCRLQPYTVTSVPLPYLLPDRQLPRDAWNFEVRHRNSMFDVLGQTSKFEVGIGIYWVKHGISKSELGLQCSTSLPPRHHGDAPHEGLLKVERRESVFHLFFLFLSLFFFSPRQTSKPDSKIPPSNFEVGTSNPDFNVRCSPPGVTNLGQVPLRPIFSTWASRT